MPAGLVVYWLASNLWTIGQQELLFRTMPKNTAVIDVDVIEADGRAEKPPAPKGEKSRLALPSGKAAVNAAKAGPKAGTKAVAPAGTKAAASAATNAPSTSKPVGPKAGKANGNRTESPTSNQPKAVPPSTADNGSSVGVGSAGVPQGSRPAKPQATKKKGR